MVLMSSVNTLLMAMFERTREIGTMLAMGTPRSWIVALFVVEATLTGVLGAVAGVVGGQSARRVLNPPGCICRRRRAPRSPCPSASFTCPADGRLVDAGHRVAGAGIHFPAIRASRLQIAEALAHV